MKLVVGVAMTTYRGAVTAPHEDELWRSIVDNYGDRAELAEGDVPAAPPSAAREPADVESEDRYVPPPPPPLPRPENKRLVAWVGLFGMPAVLLSCLILGIGLPSLLAYLMAAWFMGGFTYLVLMMPKGPRDPGDDGARI